MNMMCNDNWHHSEGIKAGVWRQFSLELAKILITCLALVLIDATKGGFFLSIAKFQGFSL